MKACEAWIGYVMMKPRDVYSPEVEVPKGYQVVDFRIPGKEDKWLTTYGAVVHGMLNEWDTPRLILAPMKRYRLVIDDVPEENARGLDQAYLRYRTNPRGGLEGITTLFLGIPHGRFRVEEY